MQFLVSCCVYRKLATMFIQRIISIWLNSGYAGETIGEEENWSIFYWQLLMKLSAFNKNSKQSHTWRCAMNKNVLPDWYMLLNSVLWVSETRVVRNDFMYLVCIYVSFCANKYWTYMFVVRDQCFRPRYSLLLRIMMAKLHVHFL